jgi:hypothetical protein
MSAYVIQPYTKQRAKELGVQVKPSADPKKKIDVFKDNEYMFSIGAKGMKDYPTYKKWDGSIVAEHRRRLYRARSAHFEPQTKGWYSRELLW